LTAADRRPGAGSYGGGCKSNAVVVAPPKTLAELRNVFHADVRARIIPEINKDLTKQPVGEIERHLTAA
jgi:protein required for attachment to host cells